MVNFNMSRHTIVGRITANPELYTIGEKETVVCEFSIAVNQSQDNTSFFNCKAYGEERANFIANYFTKGDAICVICEQRQRTWKTDDGEKRSTYDNIIKEIFFVDAKSDKENAQPKQEQPKQEKKTTRKAYIPKGK